MRAGSRTGQPGAAMIAGWLFADLLLVLFIIQLGAGPAAAPALAGASPKPIAAIPSVTAPPGLDPDTASIVIDPGFNVDRVLRGDPPELGWVVERFRAESARFAGHRAGVVMVFGTVRSGGVVDTKRSSEYAERLIPLLTDAAPDLFPADPSYYRNYVTFDGQDGAVKVELFLFR